jgi:hypothetical protein
MRISCETPTATSTHTEYVVLSSAAQLEKPRLTLTYISELFDFGRNIEFYCKVWWKSVIYEEELNSSDETLYLILSEHVHTYIIMLILEFIIKRSTNYLSVRARVKKLQSYINRYCDILVCGFV